MISLADGMGEAPTNQADFANGAQQTEDQGLRLAQQQPSQPWEANSDSLSAWLVEQRRLYNVEVQPQNTAATADPLGDFIATHVAQRNAAVDPGLNEFDRQSDRFASLRDAGLTHLAENSKQLTGYQHGYLTANLQSLIQSGEPVDMGRMGTMAERAATLPHLGVVSERFERGPGGGPGTVSSGVGDPGGVSYGNYQMSSVNRVPQAFLAREGAAWQSRFADDADPTVRNGNFASTWRSIAAEQPADFGAAQHAYIERTHYAPVLDLARSYGFAVEDVGVQNALFSQSVQHGFKGNKTILHSIAKAVDLRDMSPAD